MEEKKNLSLTHELNPVTMNFNYCESSADLEFIESKLKRMDSL